MKSKMDETSDNEQSHLPNGLSLSKDTSMDQSSYEDTVGLMNNDPLTSSQPSGCAADHQVGDILANHDGQEEGRRSFLKMEDGQVEDESALQMRSDEADEQKDRRHEDEERNEEEEEAEKEEEGEEGGEVGEDKEEKEEGFAEDSMMADPSPYHKTGDLDDSITMKLGDDTKDVTAIENQPVTSIHTPQLMFGGYTPGVEFSHMDDNLVSGDRFEEENENEESSENSAADVFQSPDSSESDEDLEGCSWAGGDPWEVTELMKEEIRKKVDVGKLKEELWAAGLLSHSEYCRFNSSSGGIPEEEWLDVLLSILRARRDKRVTFSKFTDLLSAVPKCRALAERLQQKAQAASSKGKYAGLNWTKLLNLLAQHVPDIRFCRSLAFQLGLVQAVGDELISKLQKDYTDDLVAITTGLFEMWLEETPDLNDMDRYDHLLDVLHDLHQYKMVETLQRKITEHKRLKGEEDEGPAAPYNYIVLPLVTPISLDESFDVRVETSTINNLKKWYESSIGSQKRTQKSKAGLGEHHHQPENQTRETEVLQLALKVDNTEKATEYSQQKSGESKYSRSKVHILSDKVCPPVDCRGNADGDVEIVLLSGEIPKIKAWLSVNRILDEKELGKLDGCDVRSSHRHSNKHSPGSRIFCLLPRSANCKRRLYFILRLQPTDPDDLLEVLTRMCVDITPSWLIFYSHQSILDEKFLVTSLPGSYYSTRKSMSIRRNTDLRPVVSVLLLLRKVFDTFHCRADPEKEIPVLHIHYVFDVARDFFELAMVHTSDQGSGSQKGVCTTKTEELFNHQWNNSVKEAINQYQRGVPIVSVGISLQGQLCSSSVTGHMIALNHFLPKIIGFVPAVVMTAQAVDPSASLVISSALEGHPGVLCRPACQSAVVSSLFSFSQVTALMDALVNSQLSDILAVWHGQVQVLTAIGVDGRDGAKFLDMIAGSMLKWWMDQTSSKLSETATDQKPRNERAKSSRTASFSDRHRVPPGGAKGSPQQMMKGSKHRESASATLATKSQTSLSRSPSTGSLNQSNTAGKSSLNRTVPGIRLAGSSQDSPRLQRKLDDSSKRPSTPAKASSSASRTPISARQNLVKNSGQSPLTRTDNSYQEEVSECKKKCSSLERNQEALGKGSPAEHASLPQSSGFGNHELSMADKELVAGDFDTASVASYQPEQDGWAEDDDGSTHSSDVEGQSTMSKLWISCRPSKSTMYVLLAFQGFPCLTGSESCAQARTLLMVATALANVFLFPMDRIVFSETAKPLTRLADALCSGHGLSKKMPAELFSGILVPTILPKFGPDGVSRHLTPHYRHIQMTREAAKKHGLKAVRFGQFFSDIQDACDASRLGHVRLVMSRCNRNYASGLAFLKMLKLVVAMTTLNRCGEDLQLQHILNKDFNDILGSVQSTLSGMKVSSNQNFPEQVKVRIHNGLLEVPPQLLDMQLDDAEQWSATDRQHVIHTVVQFLADSQSRHSHHASHKEIEPKALFDDVEHILDKLILHRTKKCRQLEGHLRSDSGLQQQYDRLLAHFKKKWKLCGERCTQVRGSSTESCHYLCLLQHSHDSSCHDCLDCSMAERYHRCENPCILCQKENETENLSVSVELHGDGWLCSKAAGHQYTVPSGDNDHRLHKCDREHRCRLECVWKGARNCGNDEFLARCIKRLDHVDRDGDKACICHLESREEHRCPLHCTLCTDDDGQLCYRGFELWDRHSVHVCEREHYCKKLCSKPGICAVADTGDCLPAGAEQINGTDAWQLSCVHVIPKDALAHSEEVGHDCGRQHRCNRQCPRCLRDGKVVYCTGLVDHEPYASHSQFTGGYVGLGIVNAELSDGHHFVCGCKHECESECSIPCNDEQPCERLCRRELGHPPDLHCDCGHEHPCGKPCSVDRCMDVCTIDVSCEHAGQCLCDNTQCLHSCSCEGCSEMCIKGHCHDIPDNEQLLDHHCGEAHTCKDWCKTPGVCKIDSCETDSHLVEQSQQLCKLKARNAFCAPCAVPIEKGRTDHNPLPCRCDVPDEKHVCEDVCPLCRLSCEKLRGHEDKEHQCNHGNIQPDTSHEWVVIAGGRDKATVEAISAIALTEVTCAEACQKAGRGHVHARLHKPSVEELNSHNAIQTITVEVKTHNEYWSHVNQFADPCPDEQKEFGLCSKVCPESGEGADECYCQCPVDHKHVPAEENNSFCWHEGHLFSCQHHCKKPCRYAKLMSSANEHQCLKIFGHTGECQCASESHACQSLCAAGCSKHCVISCEEHEHHDGEDIENWKHDCGAEGCCCECSAESECHELCILEHMHASEGEEPPDHHCGFHLPEDKNRQCQEHCQLPGICSVEENDVSVSQERALRGKKHCSVNHWWGLNPCKEHYCSVPADEHTCEETCKLCGAFCRELYNHGSDSHYVEHGRVQAGICEDVRCGDDLDPLVLPESTWCAEVCQKAGRRHFHRVKCPGREKCLRLRLQDGSRQIHNDENWDYVSHSKYWECEEMNDPSRDYLDISFDKELDLCTAVCHPAAAECQTSYCSLKLFHDKKAPRSGNEDGDVHSDRVLGAKCAQLLRGHHFPDCQSVCKSKCSQCADEGIASSQCCLRYGHDQPVGSSEGEIHLFQIKHHVCAEHELKLCEKDICPMCKTPCAREEHDLESSHWCVHRKIRDRQLAEVLRMRLIKSHLPPDLSTLELRTCGEICHNLGEDHHHWIQPCSNQSEEKCLCHESRNDDDAFGAKHHKDRQCDSLPHSRFWRKCQWEEPTYRSPRYSNSHHPGQTASNLKTASKQNVHHTKGNGNADSYNEKAALSLFFSGK